MEGWSGSNTHAQWKKQPHRLELNQMIGASPGTGGCALIENPAAGLKRKKPALIDLQCKNHLRIRADQPATSLTPPATGKLKARGEGNS